MGTAEMPKWKKRSEVLPKAGSEEEEKQPEAIASPKNERSWTQRIMDACYKFFGGKDRKEPTANPRAKIRPDPGRVSPRVKKLSRRQRPPREDARPQVVAHSLAREDPPKRPLPDLPPDLQHPQTRPSLYRGGKGHLRMRELPSSL